MKKYELTSEFKFFFGRKLFRIKSLVKFGNIEIGTLGVFIEKEENLDQSGDALVYGDADILHITGLGTIHRTTTAFRTEKEVKIAC